MELNTKKYQYKQDGKDYLITTGLVGNTLRITCRETSTNDSPCYSNRFILEDLRMANQFFMLIPTIEDALIEINKGIERQKSGLSKGLGDKIYFIGYLVIGTDNDMYRLPLVRDYEPNKYGTFDPPDTEDIAELILPTKYNVDGRRLKMLENEYDNIELSYQNLANEIEDLVKKLNQCRRISVDLREENALLKERLKNLNIKIEEKKPNIINLIADNNRIKFENSTILNEIKYKEALILERQKMQTKVRLRSKPNLVPGSMGVSQKYIYPSMKTFLPRGVKRPHTEEFRENGRIPVGYFQTPGTINKSKTMIIPTAFTTVSPPITTPVLVREPVQVVTPSPTKIIYTPSPNLVYHNMTNVV